MKFTARLLNAEMHQRGQAKKAAAKLAGAPEVGIIFVINGQPWIDGKTLRDADDYGHMKMQTHDHFAFWEQLRRAHLVPDLEYDEVPRGRVTYDTKKSMFYLFLDRCIIKDQKMVDKIERQMNLPSKNTKIETDPHYKCPGCMPKSEEIEEDWWDEEIDV